MSLPTYKKLAYLKNYLQDHFSGWKKKYPNIQGAYVGKKRKDGKELGVYSFVFFVRKKAQKSKYPIPEYFIVKLPRAGSVKVPTDVIEVERFRFYSIRPGHKIKKKKRTDFGTIGLFVTRKNFIYACTNMHVLLPDLIENGVTFFNRPMDQQIQSDALLIDNTGNQFTGFIEEAHFDFVDAAIVRLADPNAVNNTIPNKGFPIGSLKTSHIKKNDPLMLHGVVSGRQQGVVLKTGVTIPAGVTGKQLDDLVITNIFSTDGDSGSPVFNNNTEIAGIVIGGSDNTTAFIPFDNIRNRLKCELLI